METISDHIEQNASEKGMAWTVTICTHVILLDQMHFKQGDICDVAITSSSVICATDNPDSCWQW